MTELLSVRDLRVTFPTEDGDVEAVRGVSFDIAPGETVGIVGESGSGKSVTSQAILRLLPDATVAGEVRFDGADLLGLGPKAMRRVRGAQISMVFQDPLSSLHPQYRVGRQIVEAIRAHERISRGRGRAASDRAARGGRTRRRRPAGSTTIRTSSPAACASG